MKQAALFTHPSTLPSKTLPTSSKPSLNVLAASAAFLNFWRCSLTTSRSQPVHEGHFQKGDEGVNDEIPNKTPKSSYDN